MNHYYPYTYLISDRTHFTVHTYFQSFRTTIYDLDAWSYDNGVKLNKVKNYQDCLNLGVL